MLLGASPNGGKLGQFGFCPPGPWPLAETPLRVAWHVLCWRSGGCCPLVGKFGVVQGEFANLARIIAFGGASEPERCDFWCWARPWLCPPARAAHPEPSPGFLDRLLVGSLSPPQLLPAPQLPLKTSTRLLHRTSCTKSLLQVAQAAAEATLARGISLVEPSRPAKRSPSLLQGKGLRLQPLAPPVPPFLSPSPPSPAPPTAHLCAPALQHPASPRGAVAGLLRLAGADVFLFVSLVSLVSRFFFLIEPLINKKNNKEDSQIQGAAGLGRGITGAPAWFSLPDPTVLPQFLGFAPNFYNLVPPELDLYTRAAQTPNQATSTPHSVTQPQPHCAWVRVPSPATSPASLCVCSHQDLEISSKIKAVFLPLCLISQHPPAGWHGKGNRDPKSLGLPFPTCRAAPQPVARLQKAVEILGIQLCTEQPLPGDGSVRHPRVWAQPRDLGTPGFHSWFCCWTPEHPQGTAGAAPEHTVKPPAALSPLPTRCWLSRAGFYGTEHPGSSPAAGGFHPPAASPGAGLGDVPPKILGGLAGGQRCKRDLGRGAAGAILAPEVPPVWTRC
ncbi:uncharacterized protein [Anas platyrhynchos]|uniref:uncharacterized protein n=1 Tax=Anas platyrhynchos TaxID=8839 RepID=UPI003AF261FA